MLTVQPHDLGRVEMQMRQALAIWSDPTSLFEQIGASLLTSTQQRFEDQVNPYGEAWKDLSDRTVERRGGDETPILQVDGYLYGSLEYEAGRQGVDLGTNSPYGAAQQFGRPDINLDSRMFLPTEGLPDDDIDAIGRIISTALKRGRQ